MSNSSDFSGRWQSPAISETTRLRHEYRANQKYLVDTIFPCGAMHLIGGPSGVGKTTWLLQQLYDWEQEQMLFGEYKSNPVPWVYVGADRSLREFDMTLCRLGYGAWNIEAYALETLIKNKVSGSFDSPDFTKHILKKFPHAELIVVEGLQALMPDNDKKRSQNKNELIWALEQRHVLAEGQRTIIATTHNPKVAQIGTSTTDERSKFLGSQGFIGSCSTMIGFEKHATNPKGRNVTIMGRNFADLKLKYIVDAKGRYEIEVNQAGEPVETSEDHEIQFLTWLQASGPVDSKSALDWFESRGLGKRTAFFEFVNRLKAQNLVSSATGSINGKKVTLYACMPSKPDIPPKPPTVQ